MTQNLLTSQQVLNLSKNLIESLTVNSSGELLIATSGAFLRQEAAANATEQFFVVGNIAPALIVGYRVRNAGDTNSCSFRVLGSLTSQTYDPSQPDEWFELVAPETVLALSSVLDEVRTVAMGIAIGVASVSGTDVIVEILVAK